MEKYKLKIEILGTEVSLFLLDKKGIVIDESNWIDNRDIAEKILEKIGALFVKNHISIKELSKVVYNCDSPYFKKNKSSKIELEAESSKGKCGFTSWQVGEITAKTLNYMINSR